LCVDLACDWPSRRHVTSDFFVVVVNVAGTDKLVL